MQHITILFLMLDAYMMFNSINHKEVIEVDNINVFGSVSEQFYGTLQSE